MTGTPGIFRVTSEDSWVEPFRLIVILLNYEEKRLRGKYVIVLSSYVRYILKKKMLVYTDWFIFFGILPFFRTKIYVMFEWHFFKKNSMVKSKSTVLIRFFTYKSDLMTFLSFSKIYRYTEAYNWRDT